MSILHLSSYLYRIRTSHRTESNCPLIQKSGHGLDLRPNTMQCPLRCHFPDL